MPFSRSFSKLVSGLLWLWATLSRLGGADGFVSGVGENYLAGVRPGRVATQDDTTNKRQERRGIGPFLCGPTGSELPIAERVETLCVGSSGKGDARMYVQGGETKG